MTVLRGGAVIKSPIWHPLSEQRIRDCLNSENFNQAIDVHLFSSINSTNRYLKELALEQTTTLVLCTAETQTEGRGRFGRNWHSPLGENIYCSTRWTFNCSQSQLSGLSLVVSLAVTATLSEWTLLEQINIKWPNDIIWKNKKLCGSLIEVITSNNVSCYVVIGIGLNVNSMDHPDTNWCSLYDITKQYIDRNKLLAKLIIQLDRHIKMFSDKGFLGFMEKWDAVDYLKNKPITITHPLGTRSGIATGVSDTGLLILIDDEGTSHHLSSGDTSLKTKKTT